jgi:hypothetical protein
MQTLHNLKSANKILAKARQTPFDLYDVKSLFLKIQEFSEVLELYSRQTKFDLYK